MTVVRLRRDGLGHAALLEEVCQRVASLSHRLQGSAVALVDQMWKAFAARDPAHATWAIQDDDGKVIGHSVAGIIPWSGEWVGWSYQTEMDQWATSAVHESFITELEAWVHEWNAQVAQARPDMIVQELKLFTPNDAKVMARHTGFSVDGTLMRRRVRGGGATNG